MKTRDGGWKLPKGGNGVAHRYARDELGHFYTKCGLVKSPPSKPTPRSAPRCGRCEFIEAPRIRKFRVRS